MKKKHVVILIAAFLFLFLVSTQSNKDQETTLEIALYSGNEWGVPQIDVYKIYDEAIALFEEQHPGVKVTYRSGTLIEDYSEWLAQKFLTGDEPDVFIVMGQDFNTLAEIGMLEGLDKYMARASGFTKADYYQKALEVGQFNGQQLAMPFQVVPTFLAMNKTLIRDHNNAIPKQDWTMTDYLNICKELTVDQDGDNHLDSFGTVGYAWDMAYYNMLGTFEDRDKAVRIYDETILAQAIEYTKAIQAVNQGYVVNAYDFSQGNVGFKSFSLAEFRAFKPYPYKIKKYSNFDWGAINYPKQEAGESKSKLYTVQWGLSSRSKEKQLGWEFIRFMTNNSKVQEMVWDYTYALPTKIHVVDKIYAERNPSDSVLDPDFLKLVIDQSVVEPTFKNYHRIRDVMDIRIKVNILEGRSTQEILRNIRRDVDDSIYSTF